MQGCTHWPMVDFLEGGLILLDIKMDSYVEGCTQWPMVDFLEGGLILLD